jgi:foldase protein PrsA
MKVSKLAKTLCAVSLSALCVMGVAGCSGNNNSSSDQGAIAATINGVNIYESTITDYIQAVREQSSLSDEDSWGEYLAQMGTTPSEVREQIIDNYVSRELIKEGADEKGITIDSAEIDTYVDKMKANYDSDEKWQEALSSAGMTEQEYRDEIELQLKAKDLYATFATSEEPSNDDMVQYAQMYASAYDGAKRSSHILFSSDDEATAQEVLNKINSGELDFAEAAKQYSTDTSSAQNGGDVGWDKTSSFVTEYTDALSNLSKGQVSGLVTSTYGIHIIKCTDVYDAPKETADDGTQTVKVTSIDQIPSEWQETIKSSLQSQNQSTAYQNWLTEKKNSSDLTINDMPSDVAYNVDMSKYESDSSSSTSSTTSTSSSSSSSSSSESQSSSN